MTKSKTSFEDAMQQLDELVEHIENGNLPLEDMVKSYRQGMALIQTCKTQLESAKMEIKKLEQNDLKPLSDKSDNSSD